LQDCPQCTSVSSNSRRRGRWRVIKTPHRYLLECPYCKYVIEITLKCIVCGAINLTGKNADSDVTHRLIELDEKNIEEDKNETEPEF